MPASAAATNSLREADDVGKLAAQPKSTNQIQSDTLGKNIDVLA
jgi:hypothetical protein